MQVFNLVILPHLAQPKCIEHSGVQCIIDFSLEKKGPSYTFFQIWATINPGKTRPITLLQLLIFLAL